MKRFGITAAMTLALAACGDGSGGVKVTDACARMDKAKLGRLLGGNVTSAELGAVNDASNGGDEYSQCVYTFVDGRMVILGTGKAYGGDESDLADRFRRQAAEIGKPSVDVTGVGKRALWSETMHGLYVFPGGKAYFLITVTKIGPGSAALTPAISKDQAMTIARALGA